MQYVHHFGTTRHVLEGARNLWIWGPLDALWLNHNWHLTHHKHPTVPWIHLPHIGRAVAKALGRPVEELAAETTRNAITLFGLDEPRPATPSQRAHAA